MPPPSGPWGRRFRTSACDAYDSHTVAAVSDAVADDEDDFDEDVVVVDAVDADDDVAAADAGDADSGDGLQTSSQAVTSGDNRNGIVKDSGRPRRSAVQRRSCASYVRGGRRTPGRASRTCHAQRRAERAAIARNWPPP